MRLLREYIKRVLVEKLGDEWLSPGVVQFLIDNYAEKSDVLGQLTWGYGKLPKRTWGRYSLRQRKLTVNKDKTKGLTKQQVSTVLHEIQHWNQHVACAEDFPGGTAEEVTWAHSNRHCAALAQHGYWDAPHEVDARAFAAEHHQDAMSRAAMFGAGYMEAESEEDAWEEIMDDLLDLDSVDELEMVKRYDIGLALRDFQMNTPENMKIAVEKLAGLGVAAR